MGEHQQQDINGARSETGFTALIKQYWILIFSAVLLVIIISFISATVAVRLSQPKIVSFDLKGITDDFNSRTAMLGEKASAKDVEQMTNIFNYSLQDTLSQYNSKGYIVLVKPAVITGTPDITAEVQANINTNLRGEQ